MKNGISAKETKSHFIQEQSMLEFMTMRRFAVLN